VAVIPLVHRNGTARASIRRGLPRRGVRLVSCRSLERARSLLESELVDAVVVDVRHGWAEGAFELAHDYPGIPVVAYSSFRPDDGALIAACRRAGLDTVLVEGVDDYAAGELIWSRCATRTRRAALADAPRMLRLTEPVQLRVWEEVLARVGTPTTTADIARAAAHQGAPLPGVRRGRGPQSQARDRPRAHGLGRRPAGQSRIQRDRRGADPGVLLRQPPREHRPPRGGRDGGAARGAGAAGGDAAIREGEDQEQGRLSASISGLGTGW